MISLFEELIDSIKEHEGWKAKAYPDPLTGGEPYTFGWGFTYLIPSEGDMIMDNRIIEISRHLTQKITHFREYPRNVQFVLMEMAYQLGVNGLLDFKKMLACLDRGDIEGAIRELKASVYYHQCTNRVEDLIDDLKGE